MFAVLAFTVLSAALLALMLLTATLWTLTGATTLRATAKGRPLGATATGATHGPHHGWKQGKGVPHHPAPHHGLHGQGSHHELNTLNPNPQVTGGPYHTLPTQGR